MKKRYLILFACFIFCFISCATIGEDVQFSVKTDFPPKIDGLEFFIVRVPSAPLTMFSESSGENATGVFINCKNNTDKSVKLIWDNCSIAESNVFISGQKYINAGLSMPSYVMPPNSEYRTGIYPAKSVNIDSKSWSISPIGKREYKLSICYEVDGVQGYATYTITINN